MHITLEEHLQLLGVLKDPDISPYPKVVYLAGLDGAWALALLEADSHVEQRLRTTRQGCRSF